MRTGLLLTAAVLAASCSRLETAQDRAEHDRTNPPNALAFEAPERTSEPTLRLALVRPATWDPIEVSLADQGAVIVSDLLFDGLTESTSDGRLVPALASEWSATPDHFAWTFALDPERTNAEQVRASVERLRTRAPDSAAAVLLADVARIDVVDAATVRFVLSSPNAGFAWLMSGLPFSIVDDLDAPTGRFELVEDGPRHSVLSTGVGEASMSVRIDWVGDEAAAIAAADAGTVDGAVVPAEERERAARDVGSRAAARSIVRFYVLDPASPGLSDPRVRQAVLAAVDPSLLIDGLSAPALVASGLVAPTTVGFTGEVCGTFCGLDPDRSRALLGELETAPMIRIGFTGEREEAMAGRVVEQLAGVGLPATTVEIAPGQISAALESALVDMFPYGWVAPAGSIDAVLPPLLLATSGANPIGSITADVDQTLASAMATSDDGTRWSLLQAAHRLALEQAVFLPVAAAESSFVVSPAFTGVLTRADGSIEIRSLP